MHNNDGKTLVSFMYLIKYLNAPFLPYESLLDTTFFSNIYFININWLCTFMK